MKKYTVNLKRIYDAQTKDDGYRILIDRLWPRGIKKSELQIDEWFKEIAPSTGLRKWFNHEPQKWPAFKRRYKKELKENTASRQLRQKLEKHEIITLLYAAKDQDHNHGLVLRDFLKTGN